MKIGITGSSGFIGKHLVWTLNHYKDKFSIVPFERSYFNNLSMLTQFAEQCDVIVHLACVNRSEDQEYLYRENIFMVEQLTQATNMMFKKPHIIYASSIQEGNETAYGMSKANIRSIFSDWAERNDARFTTVVMPNVYGPFAKPNHNTVVATFCSQLIGDIKPTIIKDNEITLVYIDEVIEVLLREIESVSDILIKSITIVGNISIKVSILLEKLQQIKDTYINNGEMPDLSEKFDKSLFLTFHSYLQLEQYFPRVYNLNTDERGSFVEVMRTNSGGQFSFSTTMPGIVRGNHYHTRKIERFSVISGTAEIALRRIDQRDVVKLVVSSNTPSYVDIPIWYTHSLKNIGDEQLVTIFWINEKYNPHNPDTFYENVS